MASPVTSFKSATKTTRTGSQIRRYTIPIVLRTKMTAADIESQFRERAVLRGGLLFLTKSDALAFVSACMRAGVSILGIDGFRISADSTQPLLEHSVDFSMEPAACHQQAIQFLREQPDTGLYFEIVCED